MRSELRVLVLDDERTVCERLTRMLEKTGCQVESFTDSTRALTRIAEQRFDVLVTDLKMPGPGGLEVLQFVRENHPATRVIVITGFATVETARQAMKGGAVDFIPKPFQMSQLRDLIVKIADDLHGHSHADEESPGAVR
jgi:DNA-binding NtrC family response regulator